MVLFEPASHLKSRWRGRNWLQLPRALRVSAGSPGWWAGSGQERAPRRCFCIRGMAGPLREETEAQRS